VYLPVSFGFACQYVSQVIGWEDYAHCSRDIFHVEGFPYKDQIEELFIVMVYCMYSQHITLSTFSISLF